MTWDGMASTTRDAPDGMGWHRRRGPDAMDHRIKQNFPQITYFKVFLTKHITKLIVFSSFARLKKNYYIFVCNFVILAFLVILTSFD